MEEYFDENEKFILALSTMDGGHSKTRKVINKKSVKGKQTRKNDDFKVIL